MVMLFLQPPKNAIKSHLENLHKGLALYSSKYENSIVLGNFDIGMDNSDVSVFCDIYDLKSLVKEPACYKNPFCLDLILTNNPKRLVETDLSDFHMMTIIVMKTTLKKSQPRIIHYRVYKKFQNDRYRDELTPKLSNIVSENSNIRSNEFLK